MLYAIYQEILYRPLVNGLALLTGLVPGHDIGLAIILLTLVVRIVLFPLTHRSLLTQRKMKELEPHINRIRSETKERRELQSQKIMELYRLHGVKPLLGCLTLFIQLPVLVALYHVFWKGLLFDDPSIYYSFISPPEFIQTNFLGLLDLTSPSWLLAFFAGFSQFFQMKLAQPLLPPRGTSFKEEMSRALAIQSLYIFPFLIFFISFRFPAALALYWTASNIFATLHEALVRRSAGPVYDDPRGKDQSNH